MEFKIELKCSKETAEMIQRLCDQYNQKTLEALDAIITDILKGVKED